MAGGLIIEGARLKEVVRGKLKEALSQEGVAASELAEFYLVNLLSDSSISDKIDAIDGCHMPLGLRFVMAQGLGRAEKAAALREIGDSTLVALGLFAEKIKRGIVDASYYVGIGGGAYQALSGVVACDSEFAEIYAELAAKFAALAAAISRMSPCNRAANDAELLSIYRRWLATGDERLAELLEDEGIPTPQSQLS